MTGPDSTTGYTAPPGKTSGLYVRYVTRPELKARPRRIPQVAIIKT
jgi:hypothetical protein